MTQEQYDEIVAKFSAMSGEELQKAFEEVGVTFISKDEDVDVFYKGHLWKVEYHGDERGFSAICDSLNATTSGETREELQECIEQSTDAILQDIENEQAIFDKGWNAAMKHVENSMPDLSDCHSTTYQMMRSIQETLKTPPSKIKL